MISPDLLIIRVSSERRTDIFFNLRANRDLHLVVLRLHIQTKLLEGLYDRLPSMEAFHTLNNKSTSAHLKKPPKQKQTNLELRPSIRIQRPIIIQNIDELQIMPLADLVIVLIVCGGDLDRTGTELHIDDDGVGDDGEAAVGDEGVLEEFTVKVL